MSVSKDLALLMAMCTQGSTLATSLGKTTEASCWAKWSLKLVYELDPSVVILASLSIDVFAFCSIVTAFKSVITLIFR